MCHTIKDFPMASLPPLSTSSPKFDQLYERRLELLRRNEENAAKRLQLTVRERTMIYGKVLAWCDDAIELRRRMMTLCKNHLTADGFDGPRAYKMLMEHLDGNVEDRSKHDSKMYTLAFEMQQKSELPNGCSATQFTEKAYAWIVHILPNLPTEFKDKFAPTEHIISMLPAELRSDGRDLERDLKKTGEWETTRIEDGLMHVMRRCKKLVEKVQKADASSKPVFVSAIPPVEYDLAQLAAVAGMPGLEQVVTMVGAPAGGTPSCDPSYVPPGFSFAGAASGQKFCANCPHKEGVKCWRDPDFSGTLPASVWLNEPLRKKIITEKKENATKMGVPCKNVSAPPKSKLDAWKEAKAAKDKARKEKKESGGGGGAPAGAFLDGLIDIDDERFGESVHMVGVVQDDDAEPLGENGDSMPPAAAEDDEADADMQDQYEDEDGQFAWHVAFIDELMFVTVFATVHDGDFDAALADLPERGKGVATICFGDDKAAAHKKMEEIRRRYFPAPARPMGFGRGKPVGLATPAGKQSIQQPESGIVVVKQHLASETGCATPLPEGVTMPAHASESYSPLNETAIRGMQDTPATASNPVLPDTVAPKISDHAGPPPTPLPEALRMQAQTGAAEASTSDVYAQLNVVDDDAAGSGSMNQLYQQLNIVSDVNPRLPAVNSANPQRRAAAIAHEAAFDDLPSADELLSGKNFAERAEANAPIDRTTSTAMTLLHRGWTIGTTSDGLEYWCKAPTGTRPTAGGGKPKTKPFAAQPVSLDTQPVSLDTQPVSLDTKANIGTAMIATFIGMLIAVMVYKTMQTLDMSRNKIQLSTGIGAASAGYVNHMIANKDGVVQLVEACEHIMTFVGKMLTRAAPVMHNMLVWAANNYMTLVVGTVLIAFCRLGAATPSAQFGNLHSIAIVPGPPPSPPPSPPDQTRALAAPRADMLTRAQCDTLYVQLLAGNEAPENMPDSLKAIIIGDTGCGIDMPNHPDQCAPGSIYKCDSKVQGAGGLMTVHEKGHMRMPIDTSHGIGVYRGDNSILNTLCAYVLLALGRASREQGVNAVMPAWGRDGYFEYPSGVRVTLLNRSVLIVRPIGYKINPERALAAQSAVSAESLGVPVDGDFGLYLGGGTARPGDLESQLIGTIRVVVIDTCRGGVMHDLTSAAVVETLIEAASQPRCRFVFVSIECRTWSAALWLPDAHGNPGKPYRGVGHVTGYKEEQGRIPPIVAAHNFQCRAACAIARANLTDKRGAVLAETPALRRTGSEDATPGCEQHVYMYDHPSWEALITEEGGSVTNFDQCSYLDDPVHALSSGPKATALLSFGGLIEHVKREFGKKRCAHKKGTHRALRGADDKGKYYTSASARYSASLCAGFARCIRKYLAGTAAHGEVSALVAGVLHGKRLPKNSVDAKFFHDSFNHGEQRVLECLQHALSDIEPWMVQCIKQNPIGPCDACLKGKAPKVGPSGSLPQSENLIFIDFYHCNVPAIFTGNTARLTSKHAGKSKFVKSVGCSKKSDAPQALELILAFYNSKGCPIGHCHSDCANELRAGGVAPLAAKHKIRITTNVAGVSNHNGVEPIHRVGRDVVCTALALAKLPLCFHELCWAWFEDGHALKPSREAPHDCSLGRLVGNGHKPKGCHRRPFGGLGYLTEAPRLPNGTLVNKYKEQAVRVLVMGYMGGESGAFETLGIEKCQPGFLCFEPTRCCLLIGESVRFIAGCFTGWSHTVY